MDKIAFVCQRYELNAVGGTEQLCRMVAEKLTPYYQVVVYTTTACDCWTWEEKYQPGTETLNGVTVKRYPIEKTRDQEEFLALRNYLFTTGIHSEKAEWEWSEMNGPCADRLLEDLEREKEEYKAIFFVSYLYHLSVSGLKKRLGNAVFIPTLHDDPQANLRIYDRVFANADAFVWNTEAEKRFAEKRFPFLKNACGEVVGIGMSVPDGVNQQVLPGQLKEGQYLIYVGRITVSKGCDEMMEAFAEYKKRFPGELKLVLAGQERMEIPEHEDIVRLGFVSEEMKYFLFRNALAMVSFSPYESFSIVTMESMMMGRPVLVTERCEVLKENCVKSNAGFYFENREEFFAEINLLLKDQDLYEKMRENGVRFVKDNYSWDVIVSKYRHIIQNLSGGTANPFPSAAKVADEDAAFDIQDIVARVKKQCAESGLRPETVAKDSGLEYGHEKNASSPARISETVYRTIGENSISLNAAGGEKQALARFKDSVSRKLTGAALTPVTSRMTETNYAMKKAVVYLSERVEDQEKTIERLRMELNDLRQYLAETSKSGR